MLNQLVLIGKVVSFTDTHVLLNVERYNKNLEIKERTFDFLNVEVGSVLMETLQEYLEVDVVIAIKGSLVSQPTDDPNINHVRIVADRASLLNNKTN
jgi:single-stranded DNA-binding protein